MTNTPERGNSGTFLDCGGKRSATPLFFVQLRGNSRTNWRSMREVYTAVEKAPWQRRFAGAVQNAFIETQKPPINLAEALRIGKPSQKMRQLLECGSLLPLWNDARCRSNCSSYLYRQPQSR